MNATQNHITFDHVEKACALFDSGKELPRRQVFGFLLLREGLRYPAQFIYRLAFRLATGDWLAHGDPRGARNKALQAFTRMGFQTVDGTLELMRQPKPIATPRSRRRANA